MLGVKVRVLPSHYVAGTNAALHQKCDILCVIGKNEIYFILKYGFSFSSRKGILKCGILSMIGKDIISFLCNYHITFRAKTEKYFLLKLHWKVTLAHV